MTYDPTDAEQWARRLVSIPPRPPAREQVEALFTHGNNSLAHRLLTHAFGGALPVRYLEIQAGWQSPQHTDFAHRLMCGLHMYGGDLHRLTVEGTDYLRALARPNMPPLLYVPVSRAHDDPSHAVVVLTREVRAFINGIRRLMGGVLPVLKTTPYHAVGLYAMINAVKSSPTITYLNRAVCEGVYNKGEPSRTMYAGVCMLDEMAHEPTRQVEHTARRLLCFSEGAHVDVKADLEIRLFPPSGTEVRAGEKWMTVDLKPYNVEQSLHRGR